MSTNKSKLTEKAAKIKKLTHRHLDSFQSLIRSASILSVGTLSSRILGFFRDVILAKLLGTGFRADAFFVAFKIPNLFRDLVGEGATNAAVVPVFAEYKEKESKEAFWRFVSVILVLGSMLLSVITIAGIFLAPLIVEIIAPGFIVNPQKLELTIQLTKIMFPYLIFIGLTAYCMAILFTFRSFTVPAFSPCLLNIAIIIAAYFSSKTMQEPVFGLAIGVLVGGALQLFVQIRPVLKTGMKFYRPQTFKHSGAIKVGKLLIPRIMGSGVYQLTVLIDTFCASLAMIVGVGGISAIYYANRIIQFPMGIFSVAIASAALPTLSGLAHKKDFSRLKRTIVFSLENIFFVMCPTTIVLLLFSNPIIRVLFQRGEFDTYSTNITSHVLAYYAIGLFGFGGIKILVSAFHALQDTKTPVKVAAFCLAINAVLNFTLMYPLKTAGIALASAIAGSIDFIILLLILDKRLGGLSKGLLPYFAKVTMAALATGIFEYWCWTHFHITSETLKLVIIGSAGFICFGVVSHILRIYQAVKIWDWMKKLVKI